MTPKPGRRLKLPGFGIVAASETSGLFGLAPAGAAVHVSEA
jgi:hypothetical protein